MSLLDENYFEKEKNPKKARMIVLVFIVLIVVAMIVIIAMLFALKEEPLTANIDGAQNNAIISLFKEEGDITYVPVKKIASYIGYEAYNGEYQAKSEELSKCYVVSEKEAVNIKLDSTRIYALDLSDTSGNYQYFDIKTPVKAIDGELYIDVRDMTKVFNTLYEYNQEANQIKLYTLPYLVQTYNSKVLSYNYEAIDENFYNQKAIFDDMLVVVRNKKVGVVNADSGEVMVEAKYDTLQYLANVNDCIVSDEGKYGVVSPKEKKTKIQVNYDDIDLMDKEAALYAVKKDGKYGMIDLKGVSKVPVELEDVGVDITKFKENNIKNRYILVDNLIPIKRNGQWGLVDVKGNLVVGFTYDSFGYVSSNNKNAINLLVIPGYDVIVACKDDKYTLINRSGQPLFGTVVDDIYMIYENGQYRYFMNYNDQTRNAEDYLNQIGISKDGTMKSTPTPTPAPSQEQQLTPEQQELLRQQQEEQARAQEEEALRQQQEEELKRRLEEEEKLRQQQEQQQQQQVQQ